MNISLFLFCAITAVLTVAGKLRRHGTGRITNGLLVQHISQFPYQVGIGSYDSYNDRYWCGGSLISNQWILTAAHCLIGKVKSDIYLGTIDKYADHKLTVGQSNYIIHELYDNSKKLNDIGLIKLPFPIQYSSNINAIEVDKNPSLIKWVNKFGIISGWGSTFTGGLPNRELQYAEVKIISNSKCTQMFGSSLITPSKICQSVIHNTGFCQGDSGGPLAAVENGKPVLIGIISFTAKSQNQCNNDKPRVFTRVGYYHQWICHNTEGTIC